MTILTTPDYIDHLILLMIGSGGDTCNYLSTTLGRGKSSISERIQKLEKIGLVKSRDAKQTKQYRHYALTHEGEKEVDINHVLFSIRMLQRRTPKADEIVS